MYELIIGWSLECKLKKYHNITYFPRSPPFSESTGTFESYLATRFTHAGLS